MAEMDAGHGPSDVYYDPFCELCHESKGRNVQGKGFCKDCYQCLCSDCLVFHKNLKGTKGHKVLVGADMPKSIAEKPPRFEMCETHPKHIQNLFCFKHQSLVCSFCASADHGTCSALKVEEACKSIMPSEIDNLYDTIKKYKENVQSVATSIETNIERLKIEREDALKEAQRFYEQVISKVNQMYDELKTKLEVQYQSEQSTLLKYQIQMSDLVSVVETSLKDIEADKGKAVDTKLFLKVQDAIFNIKQFKSNVDELKKNIKAITLSLAPSKQMEDFLASSMVLGTLRTFATELKSVHTVSMPEFKLSATTASHTTQATLPESGSSSTSGASQVSTDKPGTDKPRKIGTFEVKLDDDRQECWITDIAVTKGGRKLMTDYKNLKVKMFSSDMKFLSSLSVPANPWGVVVTSEHEAVVGIYGNRLLRLHISDRQLDIKEAMCLKFAPQGIIKYQNDFVTVSELTSPASIRLLDSRGNVQWELGTDKKGNRLFQCPRYVCSCSRITSHVIVTDFLKNALSLVKIQGDGTGEVISTRQVERKLPSGITKDNNGTMYVCYYGINAVAALQEDLSGEKIVLSRENGLRASPQAIVFDERTDQFIISYNGNNFIDIFHL